MNPWVLFGATVLINFIIYNILTWGLNIQFGYTGIPNFTYITFLAAGAYVTGVTSIAPSHFTGVEYILGFSWPFPLPLLAGGVAAGLLGFLVGLITLTRLRSDYLAIVTFAVGFVAYDVVSNYLPLFNGYDGISGVPLPLNSVLQLDFNSYTLFFIPLSAAVMAVCWVCASRICNSPLGRAMRSVREDIDAAEALGKNTFRLRMTALVVGCVFAGIAGGLTIEFVSAFNPSGWTSAETFVVFAAMLLGGRANNWGSVIGSFLVPGLFVTGSAFLPIIPSAPYLIASGRFFFVGLLLLLTLWFRPEGILPERRRRFLEVPLMRSTPATSLRGG